MKNTVMHIVGNRPQFIKLAPVSRVIREKGYKEVIIHTGQHYDENMSEVFFEQLGIPNPDRNLKVGSGSHAQMTAKAMIEIEKIVLEYSPKSVIVYGDTNSTLAAALVCSKLNIPISHVEAGPRLNNRKNPEECNRLITDHLSELLFCPDEESVVNLKDEGITEGVYFTGDVMYDSFLYCSSNNKECSRSIVEKYELEKDKFILMTWHRQENTSSRDRMFKIINFISEINSKIIFPIHPRTLNMLGKYDLIEYIENIKNLILIAPLGYIEIVELLSNCKLVLTDSGGLSKESVFGGTKCLFMLENSPWMNLENIGWISTIDFNDDKSIEKVLDIANSAYRDENSDVPMFFGNGKAASKIVSILEDKELI
jgi:UDP-N-acetylglucosamine 2-epimerase